MKIILSSAQVYSVSCVDFNENTKNLMKSKIAKCSDKQNFMRNSNMTFFSQFQSFYNPQIEHKGRLPGKY